MDRVLRPPGSLNDNYDENDDEKDASLSSLMVFRGGGEVRQFRGRYVRR